RSCRCATRICSISPTWSASAASAKHAASAHGAEVSADRSATAERSTPCRIASSTAAETCAGTGAGYSTGSTTSSGCGLVEEANTALASANDTRRSVAPTPHARTAVPGRLRIPPGPPGRRRVLLFDHGPSPVEAKTRRPTSSPPPRERGDGPLAGGTAHDLGGHRFDHLADLRLASRGRAGVFRRPVATPGDLVETAFAEARPRCSAGTAGAGLRTLGGLHDRVLARFRVCRLHGRPFGRGRHRGDHRRADRACGPSAERHDEDEPRRNAPRNEHRGVRHPLHRVSSISRRATPTRPIPHARRAPRPWL